MGKSQEWKLALDQYIRQGDPGLAEKSAAWQTAIGLQDVDGLKISEYLLKIAKEHIEGRIDMNAAKTRIQIYYEKRKGHLTDVEERTREADLVSLHIVELLGEKTFQLSPAFYINIHKRLFTGVFPHAGRLRSYNITKDEWILNGKTVYYASYNEIQAALDYDFSQEKQFPYETVSVADAMKHIAAFTSGIWQIHPFGEGNTRTTAIFVIQYLKAFGLRVNSDVFAEHSWYFRNALVRSNYNDFQLGIHAITKYLEQFFENLLMNMNHELKNRYLRVDYRDDRMIQSENAESSKCIDNILNCTLEEMAVMKVIEENPRITQKALSAVLGKSERTIKTRMGSLKQKGLIQRKNGKRNGDWEILTRS